MTTQLSPPANLPTYALIIRAQWCGAEDQLGAIEELTRRGVQLTPEQIEQGKITLGAIEACRKYARQMLVPAAQCAKP